MTRRPLLVACAVAVAAVLGGCAAFAPAGPEAGAVPPALPAQWSRTPPAADPAGQADWWQRFGDPLLVALVDEALARNLDLASARAALDRARALRDATAAHAGPQVGTSAAASRNRSGGHGSTSLRAGLDASWEVDLFGASRSAIAAADAEAAANAATLQATRLAVAGEVGLAYLQWQGTRRQLTLTEASVESQAQSLQLARWRAQAGLATVLDVDQVTSNLEQTRARLPALRNTIAQAEHRLAVLLGQPPAALAARLAAAPVALRAPGLPATGVPAELLRRRYDLRAAELRVASALATLAQRRAERLPSFSINGNLALQAATLSALGGPAALVAGLAANVNWPICDSGAGAAQVAAQRAALDGARVAYQAAVLTALQDVEDQLVAVTTSLERVAALERAAAAADEALQLSRQRYAAGLADFAGLLDGERSALSTADALNGARTDVALGQVRLYKALGGAWDIAAARP